MRKRDLVPLALSGLLACTVPALTQRARPAAAATSGKAAGKKETFQYIRGKLLLLAFDGIHKTTEVKLDAESCLMTATYADGGVIENPLGSLDTNAMHWNADAKESYLSLDVLNTPDSPKITFTEKNGHNIQRNYTRFPFSLQAAAEVPHFQADFEGAVKRLIVLCGGSPTMRVPQ